MSLVCILSVVCMLCFGGKPTTDHPHLASPRVANLAATGVTLGLADSQAFLATPDLVTQTGQHWVADNIHAVRIGIPWAGVEATPGNYDWSRADRVVDTAIAANATIICAMTTSPLWAMAPGGIPPNSRPASFDQYANFTAKVADRYRGKIAAYEVWNEPNGIIGYSPAPDARGYTAMLKAAYPKIKAADPNAIVVGGVLGSGKTWGNWTINPVNYLTSMYTNGAGPYFDALSYHPYSYSMKFSGGMTTTDSPVDQLVRMRKLMISNGDSAKKIWGTEFGVPTNQVSEATQAAYISDVISTWQELPYAGPLMIYTTRDLNSRGSSDDDRFGIYRSDWTPKAARQVVANPPGTSAMYQQFSAMSDPALGEVLSPVFKVNSTTYAQKRTGWMIWLVGSQFVLSPLPVGEMAIARNVVPKSAFTDGYQDFGGGTPIRIWYSPTTGAHWASQAFAKAWVPRLGMATSNETGFGATRVNFENGYITWTPFIGARVTLTAP
ncbi:MAG: cellulase family glycosylhydrolase [Mycobacterium sp.]